MTGNGKSSTTQTLLVFPPVFHPTTTLSNVPPGVVTSSMVMGLTCSPPMFPIFPQDVEVNAFGPFPPELESDVAKAESHAIEDLKAPL